jgi:saccharopine dehydrogenase-like NADP-dependent oxidoreductase
MSKAVVLGCGLVGKVMVRDLADDPNLDVHVHDLSESNLNAVADLPRVQRSRTDLSDPAALQKAVRDADVVVGAVPGFIGFRMLSTVIEAGKPIADISFAPEDAMELDQTAKKRGVTAVVDCGVSPGLSNLAIGRAAAELDEIESVVIFVGGLPRARYWPFEYRGVFSPTDVIEEYTRPARIVEDGRVVIKEALSEVEPLDFPGIGTLEAFNTDGLRTLITTVRARNMREKTLRYPGHVDRMRMLRETGFFGNTAIDVDGVRVVPRRLTEKLLFEQWRRPASEEEVTVLRVVVEGRRATQRRRFTFDLFDRTDFVTGNTSMARTTGFPCAIVARMLARKDLVKPGIQPPELLGQSPAVYDQIVSELTKRNVTLRQTTQNL